MKFLEKSLKVSFLTMKDFYGDYQIQQFSNMIRTLLWEGEDQKAMSLLVDLAYRLVVDINTGDGVNIFEDFYLEDYEMFTRFLNESIESEALLTDFQYILLTNLSI